MSIYLKVNKLFHSSLTLRTLVLGILLSIVACLWNVQIGAGIMLGLIFGLIHHLALSSFISMMLGMRRFNQFLFILYFLGNFGMLVIPLYIGSVYPDFVNVFGAAFGLLLHKIMIYVESIFLRRKEE